MNYTPTSDGRRCVKTAINPQAEKFAYAFVGIMAIGMIFSGLSVYFFDCSSHSMLGVIYQIQIMMLIPLIGVDVGEDVVDFYRTIYHVLFSYDFIPEKFIFFGYGNFLNDFKFMESNKYLSLMNIADGSALANMTSFIFTFSTFILVIALIFPGYAYTKDQEPDTNRHKMFRKLIGKATSKLILRALMLSYVFIMICCASELAHTTRITKGYFSYIFAFAIFCLCAGFIVLAFIIWLIAIKQANYEKLFYSKEFFSGIKNHWSARTYTIMWLLRRFLFVSTVFLLKDADIIYKFAILITSQLLYIIYLCKEIPFEAIKDTITEIMNELFVLAGLGYVAYFSREKQWDWNINAIFLGALLFCNVAFTVISLGGFLVKLAIQKKNSVGTGTNLPTRTRVQDISRVKNLANILGYDPR